MPFNPNISQTETNRLCIETHSEMEVFEALHDLAMHSNPEIATYGRGLKILLVALNNWHKAETDRQHDLSIIVDASVNIVAQLVAETAITFARRGCVKNLIQSMTAAVNCSLAEHIAHAEIVDKRKPRP